MAEQYPHECSECKWCAVIKKIIIYPPALGSKKEEKIEYACAYGGKLRAIVTGYRIPSWCPLRKHER